MSNCDECTLREIVQLRLSMYDMMEHHGASMYRCDCISRCCWSSFIREFHGAPAGLQSARTAGEPAAHGSSYSPDPVGLSSSPKPKCHEVAELTLKPKVGGTIGEPIINDG